MPGCFEILFSKILAGKFLCSVEYKLAFCKYEKILVWM